MMMENGIDYDLPKSITPIILSNSKKSGVQKLLELPFVALKLKKYIKENDIDTVMSFLYRPNYINILAKIFGSNHKSIINIRSTTSRYKNEGLLGKINLFLINNLFDKANLIISNSKGVDEDLKSLINITANTKVIYNPVDIKYINSKKISVIKLVTLYQLYWPKGVNCHWCTSWSEVLRYKNEGHEYSGVFGYICAEEEPGTLPLYRMYWSKGRNSHYITSWAEVRKFQNEGHEYQGIVGYIYTWNEVNTIPVYSLYYPKGRDSHYLTDKAEVDRFIRERGDQYGGILGYVYP